jgi:methylglutaconyl-CoA hydratase
MSLYTKSLTRLASISPRCPTRSLSRLYSSQPSLITSESYDAPHCGTIKILKLDRPEARNAISKKLLNDLKTEIESLKLFPADGKGAERDSVRALIIASNVDGVFCAGADLKERLTFSIDEYV